MISNRYVQVAIMFFFAVVIALTCVVGRNGQQIIVLRNADIEVAMDFAS